MHDHHDSSRKEVTLEQLLQLKRLEKPAPEFWTAFDGELKEKQLKALVKPTRRERFRAILLPRVALWAPLSATGGVALVLLMSFPFGGGVGDVDLAYHYPEDRALEEATGEIISDGGTLVAEAAPAVTPRTDARFVVDALIPDEASQRAFRTVSLPQTFVASRDDSAYYVVNAFTADVPGYISMPGAVLEF